MSHNKTRVVFNLISTNARELQRLIEYKAKRFSVPVVYINPRNSS